MASYERSDSSKFCGGRSNFSQTCNLLSQYLKEKGSFGDLSLGLTSSTVVETNKGALNSLQTTENSGTDGCKSKTDLSNVEKGETKTAPLTMFYGGQVIVFDNFRADNAEEIFTLARKSCAAQSPAESATTTPLHSPQSTLARYLPLADLPIARRKSLARFLEKRKDRITANSPYEACTKPVADNSPKPSAVKVESEAWLGLASQEL